MTSLYSSNDLDEITHHAYGHSIATGAINPADARERVRRVLTWLTDHGQLTLRATGPARGYAGDVQADLLLADGTHRYSRISSAEYGRD